MTADADRARAHIADITKYALKACCALCATLLLGLWPYAAEAQDQPIFLQGDAVVTGYSGIRRLKPAPGQKQEDLIVINRQGASLQVFDLSQMFGADDARLVNAQRFHSVTAGQIGQVFGVALDDGRNGRGPNPVPNIYATATSAFGLQIVETANGERNRAKVGGPNRTWMSGQFGKRRRRRFPWTSVRRK